MPGETLRVPAYLERTYWWAYVHPRAVRLFERPWLVNLILWGNFDRLRGLALDALDRTAARTLQVACVYGDLTARLREALDGALDVVDVLPVQLENLARKLPPGAEVGLHRADSAALPFGPATYAQVLLFFLLHEQPAATRRATLAEAFRVLEPGGRLVIVDYHRPAATNPLRLPMAAILRTLEPFALDLWREPVSAWLPPGCAIEKATRFGGLYQRVIARKGS